MTQDEKSHTQTQITRDLETFIQASKERAAKNQVVIADEEIRTAIKDALAGPDRSDSANVTSPRKESPSRP